MALDFYFDRLIIFCILHKSSAKNNCVSIVREEISFSINLGNSVTILDFGKHSDDVLNHDDTFGNFFEKSVTCLCQICIKDATNL